MKERISKKVLVLFCFSLMLCGFSNLNFEDVESVNF